MAFIGALLYSCVILVTLNVSSCFEGIPQFNSSQIGIPQIPGIGSGSSILSQIEQFGSLISRFPFFGGFGFGRSDQQAADVAGLPETPANTSEDDPEGRLFFSRFPTITSCNTTAQGGRSCLNCRQALTCLSNNLGLLTTCRGFLPYCNGGRCSYIQPANCTS